MTRLSLFSRALCITRSQNLLQPRKPVLCHRCFSNKAEVPAAYTGPKYYFMLTIPAVTFCLGTWQVFRRRWKVGLIEELENRIVESPIPLPEDIEELNDLEYRKIKVRGHFDHSKEVYISPRSFISGQDTHHGMFSTNPSGALVVTPFHLADRDLTILVNRGWVPRTKINPSTRKDSQIEGEIEVVGVARMSEKGSVSSMKPDLQNRNWYSRNIAGLAHYLGTAHVFLDADSKSTIDNGPVGGQTNVNIRNEHLSYIITWYSLCIATLFLWYTKIYKVPQADKMVKYLKKRKLN